MHAARDSEHVLSLSRKGPESEHTMGVWERLHDICRNNCHADPTLVHLWHAPVSVVCILVSDSQSLLSIMW